MPVRPTFPGVYIEEIPSGVHPITGVATSTAAFIGTFTREDYLNWIIIVSKFQPQKGDLDSDLESSLPRRTIENNLPGSMQIHQWRLRVPDGVIELIY